MQSRGTNHLSEHLSMIRGKPLQQGENAYLLIDGVRVGRLSEIVRTRDPKTWRNLFNATLGSPLFEVSPLLIKIEDDDQATLRLLLATKHRQSSQLMVSYLPIKILATQLTSYLYIEEVDGTRWVLAFWDPFVMASLVGIQPPLNHLIPGPILDSSQISGLLHGVTEVIFQNREGRLQCIEIPSLPHAAEPPLVLTQAQIDMLTDLDLPDRVAAILRKAEPDYSIGDAECHRLCCKAILKARSNNRLGLDDYCENAFEMLGEMHKVKETQE